MQPSPNFRRFSSLQKDNPFTLASILHFPLRWQSLIHFPSLRICLFWTYYINGINQYSAFGVWLPSLNIIFSSFTCVIACIRTSSPFIADNIQLHRCAESYGNSLFNLLRNCQNFSRVAAQFYISTRNVQVSTSHIVPFGMGDY